MSRFLSLIEDHEGPCVQVDNRWSTLYQLHLPVFRLVKRRFLFFKRPYGPEFFGVIGGDIVTAPIRTAIQQPHRNSTVRASEATAMARGERPESTRLDQRRYREAPYKREDGGYGQTPTREDTFDDIPWRSRRSDPPTPPEFKSGGGGDFGGGGATARWDEPDSHAVQAVASLGSFGPVSSMTMSDPEPTRDSGESCRASDYTSSSTDSSSSSSDSSSGGDSGGGGGND